MFELMAATSSDLPALYRVALVTGDGGDDATAQHGDPDLIGHVFVGPYVALASGRSFAVVDERGIAGYVLGAPSTPTFLAERELDWFAPLRRRYGVVDTGQLTLADRDILELFDAPYPVTDELVERFPAHLHIDLLERCRGRGVGRAAMARMMQALADGGAHGVHLEVDQRNERAIGFYRSLGFDIVDTLDDSHVMARDLDPPTVG